MSSVFGMENEMLHGVALGLRVEKAFWRRRTFLYEGETTVIVKSST